MNKFNLTFSGEILPGQEPGEVRRRFGQFFSVTDPDRLERFFSGETITLRRNLERKAAAECFQDMRRLGVVAELVKVSASEAANAVAGEPVPEGSERETHFARPKSATPPAQARDAARREQAERERERAERERKNAERERERAEQEKAQAERQRERKAREDAERQRKKDEREQARAERRAAAQREAEEKRARKEAARVRAAEKKAAEREEREREQAQRARERAEREREEAERAREKAERERQAAEAAAEAAAAARAEKERQRAEAAARAEEERQRKRAEREQKRQAMAARKAEREEARRRAAAEAARQRIFEEEQRRQAEAEQRRAEAEQRKAREAEQAKQAAARREAEAAQQRARAEEEERRQHQRRLAEQARRDAEARERAEADARDRALAEQRAEEARQRELLDAQALERAGKELTSGSAVKPVKARVKTRLGVNSTRAGNDGDQHAGRRKRQPGEPNLFALSPFRNTTAVRERPDRAERALRRWAAVGVLALVALLGLFAVSRSMPEPVLVTGASALAPLADGGLVMLAGDKLLLHDRAGNPTVALGIDALGLADLSPPLALAPDGSLLAVGSRPDTPQLARLLRCQLDTPGCADVEVAAPTGRPTALAYLDIDNSLLLATTERLLRLGPAGELSAEAAIDLPESASMVPHAGLLFINRTAGPAVSVLRYDASAFAQQLDEILLLPPGMDPAMATVDDLALLEGQWWAVISTGDGHPASLHRFDDDWNHLGEVSPLPPGRSLRLMPWSGRMLVNTGLADTIARYSAAGSAEAPLASPLLAAEIAASQRRIALQAGAWRSSFLFLALVIVTALGAAYLCHLRRLVYRLRPAQGAAPVEDHRDSLAWIEPDRGRRKAVRGLAFSYAVLCLALCLLAIGQGASAAGLAALLIMLSGPAAGLLLVSRHPVGHLGVAADRLLLVDHAGTYHFGSGAAIQYRGAFLLMDDVAVFTGNSLLPAFPRRALEQRVAPLVRAGVRVDRRTVAIKLLQARHPLAIGALLSAASCAAGVLFLLSVHLF